jgi:hypothetical protein
MSQSDDRLPLLHDLMQGWIAVFAVGLLFVAGCRNDKATDLFNSVNGSNIQRLANLYCVYQASNQFKGPKDEQQFKEFIKQLHPSRHKYFGVDVSKVDELFISERDQQPFKIRWELTANPRQGLVPIVFEQQGVNGKYMIGFSSFEVREVEQSDYDQYWSGKKDGEVPTGERGDARGGK